LQRCKYKPRALERNLEIDETVKSDLVQLFKIGIEGLAKIKGKSIE